MRYAAEPTCDNWHGPAPGPRCGSPVKQNGGTCRPDRRCRPDKTRQRRIRQSPSGTFTPSTLCAFATIFSAVKPKTGTAYPPEQIPRNPSSRQLPFQTNILVPVIGNTCFHRHASATLEGNTDSRYSSSWASKIWSRAGKLRVHCDLLLLISLPLQGNFHL